VAHGWYARNAFLEAAFAVLGEDYEALGAPLGRTVDGLLRWALRDASPERWGELYDYYRDYAEGATLAPDAVRKLPRRMARNADFEATLTRIQADYAAAGRPFGPDLPGLLAYATRGAETPEQRRELITFMSEYLVLTRPWMAQV
jgi:hypothetical protein